MASHLDPAHSSPTSLSTLDVTAKRSFAYRATLRLTARLTAMGGWLSRRPLIMWTLAFWLVTRAIYAGITYFAISLPISSTSGRTDALTAPPPAGWFFAVWRLWDGWSYESIAKYGYTKPIEATFFPLYPMLMHGVAWVIQGNYELAGTLVSAFGSLLAFLGITLLAAGERSAPWHTLRAFAAFPLALFLTALYADGLFIGLCAFALLFARQGGWYRAALFAFLACLTRPAGAVLFLPLVYEYARRIDWQGLARSIGMARFGEWFSPRDGRALAHFVQRALQGATVVLAAPAAYLLFSAFCRMRYGDALAWVHAQALFGRESAGPWQGFGMALWQFFVAKPNSVAQARVLIDLAPVLIVLIVTLVTLRRQPVAFTLLNAGVLLLSLSAPEVNVIFPDALAAAGRQMLVALPVFLAIGGAAKRYPWLDSLLMGGGFALQAVFIIYIFNGGWII